MPRGAGTMPFSKKGHRRGATYAHTALRRRPPRPMSPPRGAARPEPNRPVRTLFAVRAERYRYVGITPPYLPGAHRL